MSKSIPTMPAAFRKKIRDPAAMCTCGRPAKDHSNHLGPCPANGCERWTWAPSPLTLDERKRAKANGLIDGRP